MKKLILLLACFMVISFTLEAQRSVKRSNLKSKHKTANRQIKKAKPVGVLKCFDSNGFKTKRTKHNGTAGWNSKGIKANSYRKTSKKSRIKCTKW